MTTALTGPPAQPTPPASSAPAAKPTTAIQAPLEFGKRGMQLNTYDDLWRFSNMIARTDFAPKDMRQNPEAIMAAIQLGAELGLGPIQAIQNIAVINGRPSVWGDSMLALCQAFPKFNHEVFIEWYTGTPYDEDFTAHCQVGRIGVRTPIVASFSVADAKKAKLWDKDSPWRTYPKRMLQMRARSFGLRSGFADVLKGLWSREEMMDAGEEILEARAEFVDAPPATASEIEASLSVDIPPALPEPAEAGTETVPAKAKKAPKKKTAVDDEVRLVRMAILNNWVKITPAQKAVVLKNCDLAGIGTIETITNLDALRSIRDALMSA